MTQPQPDATPTPTALQPDAPPNRPVVLPEPQPDRQASPPENRPDRRSVPGWRFWLPMVAQLALVVAVPAQSAYTFATGRPVTLQTAPVDPYDLLRGYSQTLSYEISQLDTLKALPGWEAISEEFGEGNRQLSPEIGTFYVILERPANPDAEPPEPWEPVELRSDRPESLPENRLALRAIVEGSSVRYGLETYYMPENRRDEINRRIGDVQRFQQGDRVPFVVDVRVDGSGRAVPVRLWVEDEPLRF